MAEPLLELGEPPQVFCWIGELNQVLLNLIVNAAHAIEEKREQLGGDAPLGTIAARTRLDRGVRTSVLQQLRDQLGQIVFPVHRLDRNTSGLILLAKNPETARDLTGKLKRKEIRRTYLAIVMGDPGESGRYEYRLRKNEKTNEVFVDPKGEEAVTEFVRVEKMGNSSLVRVRLLTGRSHQIRVHFAEAGHALTREQPRQFASRVLSFLGG